MATQSEHVYEVTDFVSQVIERSAEVPVLVDFWAPWCGPCRMLSPLLEKLADEYAGAFVVAKVNTDEHQAIAAQLGIRGIPDVRLVIDRQVKGAFVGAQPEPKVRAFLQEHLPGAGAVARDEDPVDKGLALLASGDTESARAALEQAVTEDPGNSTAHLALARLALARRDFDALARHVDSIEAGSKEREAAAYVEQAARLIQEADALGDQAAMRDRLSRDPGDLEAHFALGSHLMAGQDYRDALESYLQVAERDRKWRDEAARKAMLTVFGLIGVRNPLSDEYRKKLFFIY
jgi:putative thioredoxin